MKKARKTIPTAVRFPIFSPTLAGPLRSLRYATRAAGPCATETKIGDQFQKEIERKSFPLKQQPILANHRLFLPTADH
jgi:hypothetical protein